MRGSAVFRTGVAPGGALAGPWVRNPLWAAARAVPSLDLRFADNKSLVDATTGQNLVTFTRASSGTYVGSDGLIKTATTNLLLQSENLLSAPNFSGSGLSNFFTATLDSLPAPNGSTSQSVKFVSTATTSQGLFLRQTGLSLTAQVYTLSIYLYVPTQAGVSSWSLNVDFQDADAADAATSTLFNQWVRVNITKTLTANRNFIDFNFRINGGAAPSTAGITLYAWGAQLEQSTTVGEYIPTTSTINSAPRFDHNPTTGESLGLLVEEARTNLSQQSDNFSDAYWTKTDCTITANESTAPDGTLTADLWTNTASPGIVASSTITKDATARTYTGSLWVKGGGTAFTMSIDSTTTTNRGRAIFNMSSGTLTSVANDGNFTNTSGTITAYANGWYRLTVTTTTSTFTGIRLRPFFSGTGSTARIWGAQVEEGAFPTSYIPTTTATVTRSADVASITGSNFSSWYRQDEGTVFSEFSAAAYSTASYAISDGTNSNRIMVDRGSTGTRYVITNAAVAQSGGAQTPYTLNSFVKTSLGYALDNCNLAVGGVLQTLDTSATIPSNVDRLLLGVNAGGAGYGNGPIKRFTFWQRRLSDSTLQEITQ